VENVRALAAALVRPLSQLRAVILQASAEPDEVAVFLFENNRLRGPGTFSTLEMRIQNEQSGSSSLFAQPMAIEPVPEEAENREQGAENSEAASGTSESMVEGTVRAKIARGVLDARMEAVLQSLAGAGGAPPATIRQGHLALLKRWYYRPEARRPGEIFFPNAEGGWPIKALLRGIGRVAAKSLTTGAPG
jgi:hypothetical protein